MKNASRPLTTLSILFFLAFVFTGCLKTRTQLRDDSEEREVQRPTPVQPAQEVQPRGQYVLDEIKAELTRIEGRLEDLERAQSSDAKSHVTEDLKKIEARIEKIELNQANLHEAIDKLQETATTLADPEELFKKGQSQFNSQDYEGAAETLGAYLKSSKAKHPQDATFMRGECYHKLKQYKKAIVEFSKFPEKFTKSAKMPEALYKIGLSFEALNMKDDAKGFYQELVEKYPKSPEAKKIRKKIR